MFFKTIRQFHEIRNGNVKREQFEHILRHLTNIRRWGCHGGLDRVGNCEEGSDSWSSITILRTHLLNTQMCRSVDLGQIQVILGGRETQDGPHHQTMNSS
jgi:hypothetical protein